jgi:CubicO group peptidase (beta-lactamase class C family)
MGRDSLAMPFMRAIILMVTVAGGAASMSTLHGQGSADPTPLAAAIDRVARRIFALDAAPGVSVVVVRDTQILYAGGFGWADIEARRPVTPETEFYIASTTKSFTGLAVAMLDLEGKIRLDEPISRYLPGIPLRAPLNGDSITVRSLLTHTHGIGDGPVTMRLAYTGEYAGDAELVRLLAEHEPNPRGREFSYGNIGYNIVGFAIDTELRESWKETLQRLIFAPLDMTRTSAFVSGRAADRLARGYVVASEGFAPAPYAKTDATMQSAGGLISTGLDMGRWLGVQVGGGRLDGRQVIPAAALAEAHRIQVPVDGSARGTRNVGYGLGWRIALLESDTLLVHNGGFVGFATHMSCLPRQGVGVAVMANEGQLGGLLVDMMAFAIYDVVRGRPEIDDDSLAALGQRLERARAGLASDRARRAKRRQNLPYPPEVYVGRYFNPAMGHLDLQLIGDRLVARMGVARSAVEVFDRRKNQLRLELFGSGEVAAVEMQDGRASTITMSGSTYRRRALGQ